MRILLVTGDAAKSRVERIAQQYENVNVYSASSGVASFAPVDTVIDYLKGKDFDMVVFPGFIPGDLSRVEEESGTRGVKGPKDIADLAFVLERIDELELSSIVPADELLQDEFERRALDDIEKVNSSEYLRQEASKPGNIMIGNVAIGNSFPIRVLAEIVDAEGMADDEIIQKADYYKRSGADIIDIGISTPAPGRVEEIFGLLRDNISMPLSADTMDEANIQAALDAGVDMVLSFDHDLVEKFEGVKTPTVIIPRKNNEIPKGAHEKIDLLEETINLAADSGFTSIIADAVLEPINYGMTESIIAYRRFKEQNDIPLLMGVGNITELFDCDTTGVNGLLTAIASECGANMVFTPEYSDKASGSVRELATAANMMYLSKKRDIFPKDLGISLLVNKDKRIHRDPLPEITCISTHEASQNEKHSMDTAGYFKIYVTDHEIHCIHYNNSKAGHCITGTIATAICDTLFNLGLLGDYSHALYMGRELQRAQQALINKTSYIQE